MMELRINPLVVKDLKEIRDYIAEDNVEKATEIILLDKPTLKIMSYKTNYFYGSKFFSLNRVELFVNYCYCIRNELQVSISECKR